MKQVAALVLVLALVAPGTAPANETWDLVKEEWDMRPWAILLASPALLVTAPFWGVKELLDVRERRRRAEKKAAREAEEEAEAAAKATEEAAAEADAEAAGEAGAEVGEAAGDAR